MKTRRALVWRELKKEGKRRRDGRPPALHRLTCLAMCGMWVCVERLEFRSNSWFTFYLLSQRRQPKRARRRNPKMSTESRNYVNAKFVKISNVRLCEEDVRLKFSRLLTGSGRQIISFHLLNVRGYVKMSLEEILCRIVQESLHVLLIIRLWNTEKLKVKPCILRYKNPSFWNPSTLITWSKKNNFSRNFKLKLFLLLELQITKILTEKTVNTVITKRKHKLSAQTYSGNHRFFDAVN